MVPVDSCPNLTFAYVVIYVVGLDISAATQNEMGLHS